MNGKYQGIWILAEQSQGHLENVSYELLTRGRFLADDRKQPLTAVVLGDALPDSELEQLIARGADRVLHASAPALAIFDPEPWAACLMALIQAEKPEILLAAATSRGRTVMPYLAGKMRLGLTADCTALEIEAGSGLLLQTRPAAGGNIMATIKTPETRPQMATVRPHSSRPSEPVPGCQGEIRRWSPPAELLTSRTRRVSFEPAAEERGVQDSEIVLAVGRGIKKAENISLVRSLALLLDGAVGASREAVDRGWVPYPGQIGLSGKTVSPKVYLAVGISGSVQHLAGMQTSESIIAINSDSEAPIFQYSELAIHGDLFTILPLLTARIAALKENTCLHREIISSQSHQPPPLETNQNLPRR